MKRLVSDFSAGKLQANITNVATSINVGATLAARLPTPGVDEYFALAITAGAGVYEIVHCTANPGTGTLTVTRAQENTTAQAWTAGAFVRLGITAATFNEIIDVQTVLEPLIPHVDTIAAVPTLAQDVADDAAAASQDADDAEVSQTAAANSEAAALLDAIAAMQAEDQVASRWLLGTYANAAAAAAEDEAVVGTRYLGTDLVEYILTNVGSGTEASAQAEGLTTQQTTDLSNFAALQAQSDDNTDDLATDIMQALLAVTPVADRMPWFDTANSVALATVTALGRSVLASADATALRALAGLGSLAVLNTVNNGNWLGTALALANGGTGATTASAARSNLGLGAVAVLNSIASSNISGIIAEGKGGTGFDTLVAALNNANGLRLISSTLAQNAGHFEFGWGGGVFAVVWGRAAVTGNTTANASMSRAMTAVYASIAGVVGNQDTGASDNSVYADFGGGTTMQLTNGYDSSRTLTYIGVGIPS